MHSLARVIKNLIAGFLDFLLVLDAYIGICSGRGTVSDYLVLVINVFVLLLAFAHYRTRRKQKDNQITPQNDQQDEKH